MPSNRPGFIPSASRRVCTSTTSEGRSSLWPWVAKADTGAVGTTGAATKANGRVSDFPHLRTPTARPAWSPCRCGAVAARMAVSRKAATEAGCSTPGPRLARHRQLARMAARVREPPRPWPSPRPPGVQRLPAPQPKRQPQPFGVPPSRPRPFPRPLGVGRLPALRLALEPQPVGVPPSAWAFSSAAWRSVASCAAARA